MGAQPKNKITRAERGKRRAGNTPALNKDPKTSHTPLHKKTLMAKFSQVLGSKKSSKTTPAEDKKDTKTVSSAAKAGVKAFTAPTKTKIDSKGTSAKAAKRTPVSRGK